MISMKGLGAGLALCGAAAVCPLCLVGRSPAAFAGVTHSLQTPDTSTTRMHISGMTCATCPVTARKALTKVPGVYDAKVTLDDSLGVVRYNPRTVSPARIAEQLTKLTGYKTSLLPDSAAALRPRSTL